MSKWTRSRRDPERTYTDEETERTKRMLARMRQFLEEGTLEDEPAFVAAVKAAKPGITSGELKKVIKQFRDVVVARQRSDLGLY
jgi:hypothetical protein